MEDTRGEEEEEEEEDNIREGRLTDWDADKWGVRSPQSSIKHKT